MDADLDTLLTALYCFTDDLLITRRQLGRPKQLTDAELVWLVVAQVLLNRPSEAAWLRYARKHLSGMFPYLPQQSGWNKRLRAAGPLIARLIRVLAQITPTRVDQLRLIDSTPVECARSRPSAKRSDLAGEAEHGYCASHSRYFWGMRLYLVATVEGMPIMWCLANPKLDEREIMQALLEVDHHLIAAGQVILADKGFAGQAFEQFLDDLGVHPGPTCPHRSQAGPRTHPGRATAVAPAAVDRGHLRHPQRPTLPGTTRRPRWPTSARHGRRHLAQHPHQRSPQTIPHRLRPLIIWESIV